MVVEHLKKYKDPFVSVKAILCSSLWNYVGEFFICTRNYESGLDFIDYCYDILDLNREKLTDKEFEHFDRTLIGFKLAMLDYLNRWSEYISYYEELLKTKDYVSTYVKSRNDSEFNKFVMYEDNNYKYVHFLYLGNHRYEIIKRKFAKWLDGKNVEHLKRHQQDRLSDEELEERFNVLCYRLEIFLRREQNETY